MLRVKKFETPRAEPIRCEPDVPPESGPWRGT
jgi:hypothetical protein